ncbi:hypothetical protein U8607_21935 [Methylobacterium durans]|uniref:hypothetical protein n=1 Tax=Methylobacterium durans TaxID=2202825 RepID=UPI002AFEA3DC|nr:hypothetical protein [Methylobacterium durans]MEA1834759.1 hypothetical protein [Methylobacterium durans]
MPDLNREQDQLVWLAQEREHLIQANRHLADWRRRMLDQMILVEDMRAKGYDTALTEALLATMLRTLVEGQRHRQLILETLAIIPRS